ncbi:MAG: hypothetical protein K1X28_03290 [Parachlamydiales bacterium]|nr:hypothetical protein [Parachlamydiales bacterium]
MIHILSSPHMILILLFSVIFIAFIVALFLKPEEFPKSRTNVFISILASVTVILIGLSLAVSAVTLHEAESLIRVFSTKQSIDKLWLFPNRLLASSTKARPVYLASFYSNNPNLKKACSNPGDEIHSSCTSVLEEQNIAIVMIQSWEDYLTARNLDATGDIVWLNNFIQWAQSPYLKEYFDLLKYNFKSTTIEFAKILFDYAGKIPIGTSDPEIYHQTVKAMMHDPGFQKVVHQLTQEAKNYETN